MALITAGGTIVAALIGAAVAVGTGAASVPALDGSPSVGSLEGTIVTLQEQLAAVDAANEALQAENKKLNDTIAELTGSSAAGGTAAEAAPVADVARSTDGTPIAINYGTCLDLDSTEGNWGVSSGEGDFCITFGHDVTGDSMTVLDAAPDAEACAGQTQLDDHLPDAPTLLGKHLCVRTSTGRYADVQVVNVREADDAYDLEITVWK